MKTKIIEGVELTSGMVDTYFKERQYEPLYWPTFFPLKTVTSLSAKTLIGSKGSRVAAAVISYNAKSPEVGRKTMSTMTFDIPKTSETRTKDELQIIEEYTTYKLLGANEVLKDYFNDIDEVFDGCNGRMEWLALTVLSATKLQLTTTNNPLGIVNETVIDMGMPDANKKFASVVWSTGNVATMDPIKDFKAIVSAGRKLGIKFTKALMHPDDYDLMTAATKFQAYFKNTALDVVALIDLDTINKFLRTQRLPEIVLIDTSVGIEGKNGVVTETNPWSENHITFISTIQQGNMLNGPIAEELERPMDVMQSKKENVLVSVKREFNPSKVVTKGEANVFPSWPLVDRCFSLYVGSDSAWA